MRTELQNLSIIWCMIHVFLLFVILFRSRYTGKKTLILTVAGMGTLMALNGIGVVIFGAEAVGRWFLLTCTLPSLVFYYVLSEDRKFQFLFTFCIADTTVIWVMAVTNLLDFYLGGGRQILVFFSRLVVFPLLEYVAYRYFRKPYLELQKAIEKGWGIFAGMTMLYYVLLTLVVQYPNNIVHRPEDVPVCVLILVLMLFTYGTIFAALYRQLMLYREQQKERILREQKMMLAAQLENQQFIRKMKHDMKAHAVMLSGLLASGRTEEASEYLKKMQFDMEAQNNISCANSYLNAIFGYYVQEFQKLDTKLELDIQIGDEELPYMELCQILSNALENAHDALRGLSQQDRKVSVQMKYSKDYLIIRVRNRCRAGLEVEKGTIPATEKKGRGHGFGLPTIQEAARRLSGDMLCYTEKGYFIVDVMVQCQTLKSAEYKNDEKGAYNHEKDN